MPLSSLDYSGVDSVFGYFRKRPTSKRSKNPMTSKSCRHYIGEIDRFFRWLHLSPDYPWRKPEDYELIRKKPDELEEDIEADRRSSDLHRRAVGDPQRIRHPLSSGSFSCWASTAPSVPTSRDG